MFLLCKLSSIRAVDKLSAQHKPGPNKVPALPPRREQFKPQINLGRFDDEIIILQVVDFEFLFTQKMHFLTLMKITSVTRL